MIMLIKQYIALLITLMSAQKSTADDIISTDDVIKYMAIHKDIIEESQSLYSESLDMETLLQLSTVLKEVRGYHHEKINHGKDLYYAMTGNGSTERGPDVDQAYGSYCGGGNITLYNNVSQILLLCMNEDIVKLSPRLLRSRRNVKSPSYGDNIIDYVHKHINGCTTDCILSKSLMNKIKSCKSASSNSHTSESMTNCRKIYVLSYQLLKDSSIIQPSIRHFFDNKPQRKILSVHTSLEEITNRYKLRETTTLDCNGMSNIDIKGEDCVRVVSGDFNAIYKMFNNKKSGDSNYHVMKTSDQFRNCEPQDHIWKNALLSPSITGDYDTVAYDIRRVNEEGANVTKHCFTTICSLCVKEIPMMLSGKCSLKHYMSSDGHILKLCSLENYITGYYIRLVHGGSRLDSGYSYRSRFLLMNLYTYAHEKIIGVNPKLTDDSDDPQVIKGVIRGNGCKDIRVGNLNKEWLQYYVKCGESIYHHNEYLTEAYRCNLKFDGYRMRGLMQWMCYNWYYIRFFLIIIVSVFIIYLLWIVGIYRYIALILCMVTSPISYIMYKYWPNFARCIRCGLPWMPWHTCNEICLCGEKFDEDHKLQCEFYKVDNRLINTEGNKELFKSIDIVIPNVGNMDYISHVRSQKRRFNQQQKADINKTELADSGALNKRKTGAILIFQAFSSFRNPFTVFTVRFALFLIIYIVFCLVIPVAIANCIRCTDRCHWSGSSYTEDCRGVNDNCLCTVITKCVNNRTNVVARSSIGSEFEERVIYGMNGCLSSTVPYAIEYILAAHIEAQGCYKNSSLSIDENRRLYLKISTSLPVHAKIYVIERSAKNCGDIVQYLSERFGIPGSIIQGAGQILNSIPQIDPKMAISVSGVEYSNSTLKHISHTQDDFKDHLKPIQDVIEESKREEIKRKNGELLQEFQNIINLLKYNGSIFGRDHVITIPQPPSFIQHIYTSQSTESSTLIDMTMQAIAGSSSAFRPVHKGKEVPLTFVISVPEVAGVYSMRYLYTTCKTSVIDVVRYDKCVGSCNDCFNYLRANSLDRTGATKYFDKDKREQVSFDNPNTWGCEGSGCWTIKTGCLCAYCSNIPDPEDCFDVYSVLYHSSVALVCLSINEDYQCEHITLGKPVERQGKIQILLQGSDEWASLIKTEMVAIHRGNGDVLTGLMNGLGESSGNFGSPQYNKNLSLLYKTAEVDAHYVCKSGEDQEVIFESCFRDTWPMKSDLQKSTTFFLDSSKGFIYHIGKNIGTLKIILNVPVDKVEWKTVDLDLRINSASCSGCYSCINGIHCNAEVESSHSGMVYAYVNPCIIRVSTLNILKGIRSYNMTIDCSSKPISPYMLLRDGNGKDLAKKSITMRLNEGNTPRTTERNSTNNEHNIVGQNDNTISSIGDFFKRWNPITAISNFFSSSIMHWILYLLLTIGIILCIALLFYYIFSVTFRKVTNKIVLGKQE